MDSPINVQMIFAGLLGLQVFIALFLGFSVVQSHRILIPATTVLQALRHVRTEREELISWFQLTIFAIGLTILLSLWEQFAARQNPIATSGAGSHGPSPSAPPSIRPANPHGPWLLPCKTSHTRQFPKKNGFSYSYLQVAFQVGVTGIFGGSMLGIENKPQFGDPSTWFSISADEYLFRGPGSDGTLMSKLRDYLKTENVDIKDVPYVYLVTAPRFLGYSFNPVSFWYLYGQDKRLKYMLLEVNNTFDERRMYLLDRQIEAEREDTDSTAIKDSSPHFRQTWPKDFHVSPFNSRKGTYSLLTHDPGFLDPDTSKHTWPQIDNTVTLRSSNSHSKLVARLASTGPSLSVNSLTFLEKISFITSWFWVGFFTFPRILREAAKLWFARGLHVWFRPEVLRSSIGRQATGRESVVGEQFGRFLQRQCRSAGDLMTAGEKSEGKARHVPIRYTHALATPGPRTWILGVADAPTTSVESRRANAAMALQVLSPVFYAQYAVDKHILRDDLAADAQIVSIGGSPEAVQDGLLLISDTSDAIAKDIIGQLLEDGYQTGPGSLYHDPAVPWRWRILTFLRALRQRKAHSAKSYTRSGRTKTSSTSHRHALDDAVYESYARAPDTETRKKAGDYRKAVTGLLLADMFTFGSPELLDAVVWTYTTLTIWLGVRVVGQAWISKELTPLASLAAFTILAGLISR